MQEENMQAAKLSADVGFWPAFAQPGPTETSMQKGKKDVGNQTHPMCVHTQYVVLLRSVFLVMLQRN